jgi:hypothetical protein
MWSKCLQEKIFSKEINDGSLGFKVKGQLWCAM